MFSQFSDVKRVLLATYFLIVLILLIFLAETFLGLAVASLLVFIQSVFWIKSSIKEIKHDKVFIGWLLVFISVFISSFFTKSVPLTLDYIWRLITVFVFFFDVLFFFRKFRNVSEKFVFSAVVIVTIAVFMMIFSSVFSIFPTLKASTPGMNLLIASYGHNHISALLILSMPMTQGLFFLSKLKKEKKIVSLGLLCLIILQAVFIIISFGRLALFIGFLEIVIMILLVFKRKTSLNFFTKTVASLGLVLLFFGFVQFIFAAELVENPFCEKSFYFKTQLCKSFSEEKRLLYFGQAFESLKEYPLGYGPGSFSLISQKHLIRSDDFSSYAHSFVLQNVAELGLISGFIVSIFFVGLSIYLVNFKNILIVIFSKKGRLFSAKKISHLFLSIAILASLFNSFFDFDWSFLSILIIHFSLVALLLSEHKGTKSKYSQVLKYAFIIFNYILRTSLLVFFSIILYVEFLFWKQNYTKALQFFPYFSFHRVIFENNIENTNALKFFLVYKNHPEVYDLFYKKNFLSINQRLHVLNITSENYSYFDEPIQNFINLHKNEEALSLLNQAHVSFAEYRSIYGYEYNYGLTRKFASNAALLASRFIEKGEYEQAGKAYKLAILFYEYQLEHISLDSLEEEDRKKVLLNLGKINTNIFGTQNKIWAEYYISGLDFELKSETISYEAISLYLDNITSFYPYRYDLVWKTFLDNAEELSKGVVNEQLDFHSLIKIHMLYEEKLGRIDQSNIYFEDRMKLAENYSELGLFFIKKNKPELAFEHFFFADSVVQDFLRNQKHLSEAGIRSLDLVELEQSMLVVAKLQSMGIELNQDEIEKVYIHYFFTSLTNREITATDRNILRYYYALHFPYNQIEELAHELILEFRTSSNELSDDQVVLFLINIKSIYPDYKLHAEFDEDLIDLLKERSAKIEKENENLSDRLDDALEVLL